MSVRRSSRIKKLELDDGTRQKILVEPSSSLRRQGCAEGPYGRKGPAKAVERLLRHDGQFLRSSPKPDDADDVSSSPLRGVFGKLSGKIQEVMKSIFPFKLFSSEGSEDIGEVIVNNVSVEPVQMAQERVIQERVVQERRSRSASRSAHVLEEPQSVPDSPAQSHAGETRKAAFAELAAFFGERRGQQLSTADVARTAQIVNSTSPGWFIAPSTVQRPFAAATGPAPRGMLTTPLPRRLASMAPAALASMRPSKMPSMQRMTGVPPPSTQLKFRTRPFVVPMTEIQAEEATEAIVDADVTAELGRIQAGRQSPPPTLEQENQPVDASPMKVDSGESPSPKKQKSQLDVPRRFVGVFYLDPDEEEQELLEQERRDEERRKRIEALVAKKQQRERKVSFRAEAPIAEPAKEAKEQEIIAAPVKPLFDFGESAAPVQSQPSTPAKPATGFAFELPSATTKLRKSEDEDSTGRAEPKRKRSIQLEKVEDIKPTMQPVNFSFGTKMAEEPKLNIPFGTTKDEGKKDESKPAQVFSFAIPEVKDTAGLKFGAEAASATEAAPTFSVETKAALATETKPVFSFPIASATGESKPAFTFGTPATTSSAAAADKPLFSFGAATAATAEPSKPVFSFGKAEEPVKTEQPKVEEPVKTEPLKFSFGATSTAEPFKPTFGLSASAASTEPPKFNFGLSSSSTAGQTKPMAPSFTFGQPEKPSAEPASTASASMFNFSAPKTETTSASVPSFNFGMGEKPSTTTSANTATPSFTFGNAQPATSSAPTFTFGTPTPATEASKPFAFGSAPTTPAIPSFSFGTAQPLKAVPEDTDMMDDSMAQPTPSNTATTTSVFGSAFGGFSAAPSPAPSLTATTPTFGFTSPQPQTQPIFSFGAASSSAFGSAPSALPAPFAFAQPTASGSSAMDALAAAASNASGTAGFNAGTASTGRKITPISRARRR